MWFLVPLVSLIAFGAVGFRLAMLRDEWRSL
jgi:hypothetical protein